MGDITEPCPECGFSEKTVRDLLTALKDIVSNPGLKAGTTPEQIALDRHLSKARAAIEQAEKEV